MSQSNAPLIIAIDGPAASGKGTLARRLAAAFALPHLDTGLTYRAVANAMLQAGLPLEDETEAAHVAATLDLGALDRDVLSQHEIGEAASKVAVLSRVRAALVEAQRAFAKGGAVLDGRDIGTVVCPDATVKLYVTASPQERARRRWNEVRLRQGATEGDGALFDTILEDIKRRDERDMGREDSPLRPAPDAHLLDTSELDIEAAYGQAHDMVSRACS
ncbi:MAG: (d)CMP kinase [Pseudomonadota bacterium]